jgi:hypothetical protein
MQQKMWARTMEGAAVALLALLAIVLVASSLLCSFSLYAAMGFGMDGVGSGGAGPFFTSPLGPDPVPPTSPDGQVPVPSQPRVAPKVPDSVKFRCDAAGYARFAKAFPRKGSIGCGNAPCPIGQTCTADCKPVDDPAPSREWFARECKKDPRYNTLYPRAPYKYFVVRAPPTLDPADRTGLRPA